MSALSTSPPIRSEIDHLYRRIDWRLLPFLTVCYVFAYLDRINIGFAKLQMQSDLHFSDAVYGAGAGIFFLGYMLFEIPSNLLMPKFGARRTLSRIMVLWGITSACMLFVHSATSFYVLRFLLGVFEAGFAPGMIFYLTYWYGAKRMARVMAIVMCAGPIGGIFGGPLSTWIMTAHAAAPAASGLAGWQWMFLIEGLPCVVLGVITLFFLDDKPDSARWLSERDKTLLRSDIGSVEGAHHSFAEVSKDWRVYIMASAYFCLICGIYAVSFWLPTILKTNGLNNVMAIGFISAIPYIASIISMILVSRSSDRLRERRWHSAMCALLGALALTLSIWATGHLLWAVIAITVATAAMWAAYTVFWAMPSDYLKGDSAAGGIALINTIGLFGGFLSPTIIGWTKTLTGSMASGLYTMVGLLLAGTVLLLINKLPQKV